MSMAGNFAVEAAMEELLVLYELVSSSENVTPQEQLTLILERIRSIKDCAKKGWY
jgi:uncharacterized protein YfkK (UPF0435 family)